MLDFSQPIISCGVLIVEDGLLAIGIKNRMQTGGGIGVGQRKCSHRIDDVRHPPQGIIAIIGKTGGSGGYCPDNVGQITIGAVFEHHRLVQSVRDHLAM